jgi:hypothetical protein
MLNIVARTMPDDLALVHFVLTALVILLLGAEEIHR